MTCGQDYKLRRVCPSTWCTACNPARPALAARARLTRRRAAPASSAAPPLASQGVRIERVMTAPPSPAPRAGCSRPRTNKRTSRSAWTNGFGRGHTSPSHRAAPQTGIPAITPAAGLRSFEATASAVIATRPAAPWPARSAGVPAPPAAAPTGRSTRSAGRTGSVATIRPQVRICLRAVARSVAPPTDCIAGSTGPRAARGDAACAAAVGVLFDPLGVPADGAAGLRPAISLVHRPRHRQSCWIGGSTAMWQPGSRPWCCTSPRCAGCWTSMQS